MAMLAKYTTIVGLLLILACDRTGRDKCRWYLVPEKENQVKADEGWMAVCARNFDNNKQDCRLQARPEFVKSNYNKKFRYTDIVLSTKDQRFPRKIESIERFCK